ncbi:hypothetical protein MGSAQ_002966 [marine sediment metagenome]|uniref:Uncharacterized protein n=1 Tax=marine sediment metagenome TaxID=412755 RepID=A0A1B6NQG7_9ZZZZ
MPGISAVSPPIRAQLAALQPRAMLSMTRAPSSTDNLPVAK